MQLPESNLSKPGEDIPQPSSAEFRTAMRGFVGNCCVITAGSGQDASGLVLTSAVSLSTDPPLLTACINLGASTFPLLKRYMCFGCSSLGAAHQAVAERFSGFGGIKGAERYEGAEWETAVTGARLLKGAAVAFDCVVDEILERATHAIVIGRVQAIRNNPDAGALIYWNGQYRSMPS